MKLIKPLILFEIGGFIYIMIELIFRGHSHWTMFALGGYCFLYAGWQNERTEWEKPLWQQVLKVEIFIIVAEFVTGCVVNILLDWNIWDYSNMPFNLYGQICLLFALLWLPLSLVAIVLDDYLRYWLFGEEKPHYKKF